MLPNEPRASKNARPGADTRRGSVQLSDSLSVSAGKAWRSLRAHPWLKICALLISLLVWAILIAGDEDIQREKTITDAVVTVVGLETLQSRALTITDDLTATPIKVKMRVKVAQRNYQTVTAQNFAPRLDLSKITQAGENQEVKFSQALTTYGTVLEFTPASVTVNVEEYSQRGRIPVEVVPYGTAASPLWFDTPIADPAQVTVSGPRSLVNQVARAAVRLPIETLDISRVSNSVSALIELQDSAGNPIDSPLLRVTSELVNTRSARVDVDVYPMRELPIDTSIAVRGTPAHGYEINRTMMVPQSVMVAGPAAALERLQTIYVETPIDVSGASEAVQGRSGLRLAPELKYSSASEVVILAAVREATHTHTYTDVAVEVRGTDAALEAWVPVPFMSVTLSGPYLTMERVTAEDVRLYVDATGLEAGETALPVQCAVNNLTGYTFAAQLPELLVTVKQRGEE
ncbi:MAG: hypothetical protein LBS11_10365 [Oscillospiraceae bacterium]|jgi:YbbR domain-containing protein|nr:hypothetical protein [Oscillospiraceae bacterium]